MTTKMKAPAGVANKVIYRDGTTATVDATGHVNCPNAFVADMFAQGFVPAANSGVVAKTSTAISTAGAGTLTAAALVGGVVTRSGPTADFTDTTDTAALIIAAMPGAAMGSSFEVTYRNTTKYTMTLAAGADVTLAGFPVVPANSTAQLLVETTASTATVTVLSTSGSVEMAGIKFTAITAATSTLAAGAMEGAGLCVLEESGQATAVSLTTRTAAQIIAGIPGAQVGQTYMLRVINNNTGTGTITLVGGTGVTITGTATVAIAVSHEYMVSIDSASAVSLRNIGSGTV